MGNISSDSCFSNTGYYFTLKSKEINKMIVGSIKEDLALEKRVSITPETAKNIMGLGLKVCIEKDYATHLGIDDNEFKKIGVEIKDSLSEVLNSSNLIIKVNCPSENEISLLKEKTILIGMLNRQKTKIK